MRPPEPALGDSRTAADGVRTWTVDPNSAASLAHLVSPHPRPEVLPKRESPRFVNALTTSAASL